MSGEEKPDQNAYLASHGADLGWEVENDAPKKRYEHNMRAAQTGVSTSSQFGQLLSHLEEIATNYADGNPSLLYLTNPADLKVLSKPFESLQNKAYRVNCLWNSKFPEAPKVGLIDDKSLYFHDKANDLLRSRLVCKYMDGPRYVADKLKAFCEEQKLEYRSYPMNSDTGYYAWHCYVKFPVGVMIDGEVVEGPMSWELQITTQLAEVITSLTHGLYQDVRVEGSGSRDDEWKWEPREQRFRSAYLGHSLHLLEGIIQTFRDEVFQIGQALEFLADESHAGAETLLLDSVDNDESKEG